ncbi:unnamed protein product [Triticum turgidum subsp. durum]|uniref:Uncharacterized protein n=1 Tax=Triticum turgidum subsp. durum TaxID=4567 RepID=A0A9R1R1P3_TRITD|nr:unnamed protein product [Triticum turgidum subsp. durum]
MAGVLVSTSIGAMGAVLAKLAAMLGDEYKLLKGVRGDIKFLKKELEAMYAFLLVMSDVEQPDEQSKIRVKAVRDLSFEIEDSIDKFMLLVEPASSCTGNSFKELISKCKGKLTDIKIHYEIAKELKHIKGQVKEVSERYARYTIYGSSSKPSNVKVDPRVLAFFKDASELVGIDGPRDELVRYLSEESESANQLKIVSLVGYGGLGKTTLANQAYHKLGGSFECRAFVSISQNPDMNKILSSILSQISNGETDNRLLGDQQTIISHIREFLENKRYFIVMDDIWDVPTWKILECALFKNKCGSRIMTTTRVNDVARACCSSVRGLIYRMKPLNEDDSKKLFYKRIFGSEEDCPFDLKEASADILKKCGGLPLAINSISSLLATRQTKEGWDQVRCSIQFAKDKSSEIEAMNYILSLSYFDLPHYLRSCLLYLTLFPEDYEIKRERLVHRWISEGLICREDGEDIVELGDRYFHELVNRSLIQPVQIGYDGKASYCRVHDIILDFLISKSADEGFCTLLGNHSNLTHFSDRKVRRLSLMGDGEQGNGIKPNKLDLSHLRSLSTFGYGFGKQVPFFLKSNALRVLDLEGCRGLKDHHLKNIGRFSQLRYLNIYDTGISELPGQIGDLQYLETLNAFSDSLDELPETINRLQRLMHLSVSRFTRLPDGIGNMKNLRALWNVNILKQSLKFVHGLSELTKLRTLTINWDADEIEGRKLFGHKESLVSSLCKLDACNLRTLCIYLDLGEKDGHLGDNPFIPSLNSIQDIHLYGGEICWMTKWLVSLVNLQKLTIYVAVIEQQDLQMIGDIPTLVEFNLDVCGTCVVTDRGFQQLQKFVIKCNDLMFESGAMPKLVEFCLSIRSIKFNSADSGAGGFDFGICHLSSLDTVHVTIDCRGVRAAAVEATEGAIRSMSRIHPNHPTLEITRKYPNQML